MAIYTEIAMDFVILDTQDEIAYALHSKKGALYYPFGA